MRIMQVSTTFASGGGIQTHVQDLAKWLTARGHAVFAAGVPDDTASATDFEFLPLRLDRVSSTDVRGVMDPLPLRLWWMMRCAVALRKAVRRHQIELIHAHETGPLVVAWLATRGLRCPLILTYHGAEPERLPGLVKTARHFADLLVSPSQTSLDRLISLGMPVARTRQMGLGVHVSDPVAPSVVDEIRASLLGETGTHLVLSLSRLSRQKAIDAMIRVAHRVRTDIPGLRIVIGGRGAMLDKLQALARQQGVDDIVLFAGRLQGVTKYLQAADLYLLTSRWEELPISIVEALREGLPVVATDCGGVRELVDNTVGELCQVDDEPALAEAVTRILENDALRTVLSANAKTRSQEDRFSIDRVNEGYEALYLQLLADQTGR